MFYTLYVESKSVLDSLCSVKICFRHSKQCLRHPPAFKKAGYGSRTKLGGSLDFALIEEVAFKQADKPRVPGWRKRASGTILKDLERFRFSTLLSHRKIPRKFRNTYVI